MLSLARCVLCSLCSVLLLTGCGQSVTVPQTVTTAPTPPPAPAPTVKPSIWVGAWGNAMTNAVASAENTGSDQSFRFLVTPTVGGTQERVRFSNVYGKSSVTLGAAYLAVGQDGSAAIDASHNVALSFAGQPSVTMAPGQVVVSDPVAITFSYGQTLAISVYFKGDFGPVSRHNSVFITNYRTPKDSGNHAADAVATSYTETLGDWLLVNGVDVYGPYGGTLALFGSSTTDGFHSDYSSDQVYPAPNHPVPGQHTQRLSDWLARRLNDAGYQIGVVNEGVPGDTVTDDITNTQFSVKNANQRVANDVLSLPNLVGIVSYFGSIDIRSSDCKSAPAIEAATQQLVATINAARVPLVLATIPPSAFCTNPMQANFGPVPSAGNPYAGAASSAAPNGGEVQRIAFNEWLRNTAATLPGVTAIADFDAALRDPTRPSFLQAPFNSGDNYHPNGAGYQAESQSLPLSFLPKP